MAAMKDFLFEAAELAFKLENRVGNTNQVKEAWNKLNQQCAEFGATGFLWDIYDEIADRSGDAWDLLTCGGEFSHEWLMQDLSKSVA